MAIDMALAATFFQLMQIKNNQPVDTVGKTGINVKGAKFYTAIVTKFSVLLVECRDAEIHISQFGLEGNEFFSAILTGKQLSKFLLSCRADAVRLL